MTSRSSSSYAESVTDLTSRSSSSYAESVTDLPRREQLRRLDFAKNAQNMMDSLDAFRRDDIFTDFTLKSSGKAFPCHKVILASTSEYFKKAPNSVFKENQSGGIELPDIDPEILEVVLEYIYGQQVTLEAANVMDLHTASHLLQIKDLIKATKDFMLRNFRECCEHQSFLEFPLRHLIEYISDCSLEVRNEDEVYEAVMRWITHDLPQRENETANLMARVRLPYCTKLFFYRVMQDDLMNKCCQGTLFKAVAFAHSSYSLMKIQPREGSMTIGLEEESVIKYINEDDGVVLSSRIDKHECSLEILGELPNIDKVSGYSVCASDTTVVITGGTTVATPDGSSFSWSLDTLTRTWTQLPKLPTGVHGHSSMISYDVIYTQSKDDILMLEPDTGYWEVLLQQNSLQIVDGNSKFLLLMSVNHDYYLCNRNFSYELSELNKPTKRSCLLKFIDDKLLALSKGKYQFRSFYWYDFDEEVWKRAGFVQVQCDGVDEKSKACVWRGNLVLTYPEGLAIFNPDTAILRHFVSCEIDNYDKCHIFPIFVSLL